MQYDSILPIAVFLGPTLERGQARRLLASNMYPPAQMGDIYRLLGAGVRLIVLIDGVFHGVASVWQRELLEAMENGIRVVGASSMGALRAAELHTFGMAGVGGIFEWYRDGIIEGDDEVALHHGDEASGYRPLSEPLVNIRYTVARAVHEHVLSAEQGVALIDQAKTMYYGARSYRALLTGRVAEHWPAEVRDRFAHFIERHAINLKRQDAIRALQYSAALVQQGTLDKAFSITVGAGQTAGSQWTASAQLFSRVSCLKRGFLTYKGQLVSGEIVLNEAERDTALHSGLRQALVKRMFLLIWAAQSGLAPPSEYVKKYQVAWETKVGTDDQVHWLAMNGLTERELHTALEQRALLAWLVQQEPSTFGMEVAWYEQWRSTAPIGNLPVVPLSEDALDAPWTEGTLVEAREVCYLCAWAAEQGIACPPTEQEAFLAQWEEAQRVADRADAWGADAPDTASRLRMVTDWALYRWMIQNDPAYFGYFSWDADVAMLRELQVIGRAAYYADRSASQP